MKVFAISDLHLSFQCDKPMDVFGENWANYEQRIMNDWNSKVGDDDVGIIAGDISWAMRMAETEKDFEYIGKLKGTKIIVRGNHDYWWSTITKVRENLPVGVHALQNDSLKVGDTAFAGTRGWKVPERNKSQSGEDKKIFNREVLRFEMSLKDAVGKMKRCHSERSEESQVTTDKSASTRDSSPLYAREARNDKLIAILHYPPFNSMRDDSPFTALCEKYGVTACVYGHLHGKQGRAELLTEKKGVKYYLTSCDQVGFGVIEVQ